MIESSPKLKSTDAQIVIRDRYETHFNIYNHAAGANDPFGLIRKNWNEDTVSNGPLSERMQQYIDLRIHDYFKVSFDEFIDRPTWQCELMLAKAEENINKEKPQVDKAIAALNTINKN